MSTNQTQSPIRRVFDEAFNQGNLTVVDELTRALPEIARACTELTKIEQEHLVTSLDNHYLLREAIREMTTRLCHAMD